MALTMRWADYGNADNEDSSIFTIDDVLFNNLVDIVAMNATEWIPAGGQKVLMAGEVVSIVINRNDL